MISFCTDDWATLIEATPQVAIKATMQSNDLDTETFIKEGGACRIVSSDTQECAASNNNND